MDRKTLTEVLEYIAAAILAIVVAVILSDQISGPFWGGLSDVHLR
jgi:hypothetical protein